MKNKKILILSGLLSISMLAACGEKDNTNQAITPGAIQPGGTSQETGENTNQGEKGSEIEIFIDNEGEGFLSIYDMAMKSPVLDKESGYIMYQGINYTIDEAKKEAMIPDYYDGEPTSLVIPDEITYEGVTYPVTEIGEDAFNGFIGLESVTIGKNIRVLDAKAFAYCYDLVKVSFAGVTEELGEQAFAGCSSLKDIVLPKSVKSIGKEAFWGCTTLEKIELPESLVVLGDYMFFDCDELKEVEIPASVKAIPVGLFTNCHALEKVTMNEGLTSISEESFWECTALESLTIPASVATIGEKAFYSSAFQSITFLGNTSVIGEDIFAFCDDIQTIYASSDEIYVLKKLLSDYELEYVELK